MSQDDLRAEPREPALPVDERHSVLVGAIEKMSVPGESKQGVARACRAGETARIMRHTGINPATAEQVSSGAWRTQCQVGDFITFGHYPQGDNDEVQPIEWQVLRRDCDGLLVVSQYALDCKPYNESRCDITWSECSLRKWLNSEFIDKAFDAAERQRIRQVHLCNPNSHWDSNVPGGPDTDDKVFLLSHDEAEQLFADSASRQCRATAYAKNNKAWIADNGMCFWWLRSPGEGTNCAADVYRDGEIFDYYVDYDLIAVRPACKIAL